MNIIEYIKKNKEYTFEEKDFNEVDNIVLSILSYLNFDGLLCEDSKIKTAGKKYLEKYTYKEIAKLGLPQKDAYNTLKEVVETERYGNIDILNYIYVGTKEEQFSAVTYKIKKDLIYVAFEGTDNLMSGWKEDFRLGVLHHTDRNDRTRHDALRRESRGAAAGYHADQRETEQTRGGLRSPTGGEPQRNKPCL